ncbi:RNA polymerase sigma-70 factor (ECF subfamily) [Arthrobacter pigmenti]|uniref:RNA polymerase sigma-70 factor (ECF subfamily) n=1 Tax=Arthrobacter pigmenti TaxID=271432 RepID=A0A846RNR7_9MICC|nr:ECF RNA polymerase sigma factor SigK [Arthrobacter pigmenti]NJC21435.1 RNA polymerase sigma-70 factor (ECF subfamily) [Arthrobacter pigmenti]
MTSTDPNYRGAAAGDAAELVGLIRRTAEGNRAAFADLYHRTHKRVYGLARRTIVDPELSEETTQDVFLMVWEQAHRYDPAVGSPMAWLMTIAHRRAVDKVRSEHSGTAREAAWGIKHYLPDRDVVADAVSDRMEAARVVECLEQLSPLQREAINLAYYECLTYTQVAEHLNVPVPTVKTRIRSGIQRLRSCMDPGS